MIVGVSGEYQARIRSADRNHVYGYVDRVDRTGRAVETVWETYVIGWRAWQRVAKKTRKALRMVAAASCEDEARFHFEGMAEIDQLTGGL